MRRSTWLAATTLALGLAAGTAQAQGTATQTTRAEPLSVGALASMCASSGSGENPLASFCQGVMIGAGQYHSAVSAAGTRPIFCLPEPSPTIEQVQTAFVRWAAANTQYSGELAVSGLMRFAAATYPCPPQPAQPARRR
ncbi:Rap1a/Tai family immunity protein [Roseomonas sp. AR75]|jgi:hypothetical protein|uniref:Rap1a/Tai family immunity protein n=1 Tax=Roseomonas sp. AR75 TaxID=2562311 RepID=UPI0010C0AEEC|nr:Rap1a/Tai family immunity protein [Roseomonas sp. AR75]